ncbi:MAG: hypothetical protein J3K34DRAFT_492591 [Monoraphidium minutum]|nr:MAG: hypothetical protein J3K34DRAFT_492591 [Monoraphidium minutum]
MLGLANTAAGAQPKPEDDQHTCIVLFQSTPPIGEHELRGRLQSYGAVVWCNAVVPGSFLVHLGRPEAAAAAVAALDGFRTESGHALRVQPYSLGPLPSPMGADGSPCINPQGSTSAFISLNYLTTTEPQRQPSQQVAPEAPQAQAPPSSAVSHRHHHQQQQQRSAFADASFEPLPASAAWGPEGATPPQGGGAAGMGSARQSMGNAGSEIGSRIEPAATLAMAAVSAGGAAVADSPWQLWSQTSLGSAPGGGGGGGQSWLSALQGLSGTGSAPQPQQAQGLDWSVGAQQQRQQLGTSYGRHGSFGFTTAAGSSNGGAPSSTASWPIPHDLLQHAAAAAASGALPPGFAAAALRMCSGAGAGVGGSAGGAAPLPQHQAAPAWGAGAGLVGMSDARMLDAGALGAPPRMSEGLGPLPAACGGGQYPDAPSATAPGQLATGASLHSLHLLSALGVGPALDAASPGGSSCGGSSGGGAFGAGSVVLTQLGAADGPSPGPVLAELQDLLASCCAGPGGGAAVDAPTFVGLLQEAASAALAAAAPGGDGAGAAGGGAGARGAPRQGAAASDGGALLPPDGRHLVPVRTARAGSEGGGAPGHGPQPPPGSPLAPMRPQELAAARAALARLMCAAHAMVGSAQFARLCAAVAPVCELYDGMHDCPVVVKRRRCREMAAVRERVMQDPLFMQALQPAVSLRAHIYALSRRVLLGHGRYDGLPVDLFLGGLSSELATLLTDAPPSDAAVCGAGGGAAPANPTLAAAAAALGALPWGAPPERACAAGGGAPPQGVLDFFSLALPLPQLAVLVFAEFVHVDPQPGAAAALPAPPAVPAACEAPRGGGFGAPPGAFHQQPRLAAPQPPRRSAPGGGGAPAGARGAGRAQHAAPVSLAAAAAAAAMTVKAAAADLGRPYHRSRSSRATM